MPAVKSERVTKTPAPMQGEPVPATPPQQPLVALPTVRKPAGLSPESTKILIYSEPGLGKTTFAAQWEENLLMIATEPGQGGVDCFLHPIHDWQSFKDLVKQLARDPGHYKAFAVDTVDELFRMCRDATCKRLGVDHPSELEWGKGWAAVEDEWRLVVSTAANLGLGSIFISHLDTTEIKTRTGASYTVSRPKLAKQGFKFLEGFVDYIFQAEIDDETGLRIVHSLPDPSKRIVKQRTPDWGGVLADPLPLRAQDVRTALTALWSPPE